MSTVIEPNASLAATNAPVIEKAASFDFTTNFAQIVDITCDLFPGEVSMYIQDDPDYPQDRYTVVEAEASGRPEDVVARQLEWHRRIMRLGEGYSNLRLTFSYHE